METPAFERRYLPSLMIMLYKITAAESDGAILPQSVPPCQDNLSSIVLIIAQKAGKLSI
jgi:hypothetical protein